MPSGYCGRCGYATSTDEHRWRCYGIRLPTYQPPYVLCMVPRCGVWVRSDALTEWGTCPPWLWDEQHAAWIKRQRMSA